MTTARELHDLYTNNGIEVIDEPRDGPTILRALDLLARVEESEDELVRDLRDLADYYKGRLGHLENGEVLDSSAAALVALKAHAEAMHGWIDRVLSCVERAEQDIGGESMATIIADGGPLFAAYRRDFPRMP